MKNLFLICLILTINYFIKGQDILTCQKVKSKQQITGLYYSAENLRSDTFDVLHYDIHLEITPTNSTIAGHTDILLTPKQNNQTSVRLDLLKMIVDSARVNNITTTYWYNDTLLQVNFGSIKNIGDTITISVYYHGNPQIDPSGWGGFYFNGNYAFNLGVGFTSVPHNFGRVWFPCFDNFVEKSTYDFYITTDSLLSTYCNGILMSETFYAGKRTRHWKLLQEIPSYLASVAVADYSEIKINISTISSGTIPAIIAARANDTNATKVAFTNLQSAVSIFENQYGPYVWPRIGYCLVTFNSGAMEHATNIAYPQLAIGTTAYEAPLMAHELSHHWWGDLVTCETQEDMWLNEGMATYSEWVFLENQYGVNSYTAQLLPNLIEMVQFGNFKEQQYWPVSGVPPQYTYSDHVYKKGALVVHNLRRYLGDNLFFNGLKYVLSQKAFKNMNSAEFQTLLQNFTNVNLNDFFNDWVFNGGYPVFIIDSAKYSSIGSNLYQAKVTIKQKLHGASHYYKNMPINLFFFDSNWNPTITPITVSDSITVITTTLNFIPSFEILNYDRNIAYASIGEAKVIKTNSTINFANAKVQIIVTNSGVDSSFVYAEHHYAAPDPQKTTTGKKYKLSNQHFWKITGKLSNGFHAKLKLNYNGTINYSTYGCMDTCLAWINADSITVLYRKDASDDWREVSHTKTTATPKAGFITIDTLQLGEYTLANKNGYFPVGIEQIYKNAESIKVYPNPSNMEIFVDIPNVPQNIKVDIYDNSGKLLQSVNLKNNRLNVSKLSDGVYYILIKVDNKKFVGKFLKSSR